MLALKTAKVNNVEFTEIYGYTPEEAQQWAAENPDFTGDFTQKQWFKRLLPNSGITPDLR